MAIQTTQGLPSATDLLTLFDALGSILKGQYSNLGVYGESETTTLAGLTRIARNKIMGDGTTTYPGLGNTDMQKLSVDTLKAAVARARYDDFFRQYGSIFTGLDNLVRQNIPSGWNWSNSSGTRPLDLWMTYLNGTSASVPAIPAFTPSLSGTTGGSIGQTGIVRVKCCYQSSSGDWLVSQPTAAGSITLSGTQDAITFTAGINSAVTGYLLVFRQVQGAGAGDSYYYDQRVAVTSGVAIPAVTMTQGDQQLRLDLSPPSWMQCMLLPEEAFLFADSYAAASYMPGALSSLFSYAASAFSTPRNVTLNPTSGFLGVNNQGATGEFARWTSTSFAEGTIVTANDSTNVIQGFGGSAGGIQLRVTSVLNNNAPITNVTYYYYDATHDPSGSVQNTTVASPGTLSLALGSTLDIGVTAGRLVTRVSAMTVGTATTGTIIAEAKAYRSI